MKNLLAMIFLVGLVGCAANSITPEADNIRVFQTEPKGCKYLGEVTGNQGNFFTGVYTSNENLETGARNDLKTKAQQKGGNAILLITNRAGNSGGGSSAFFASRQTNVTLSATVYNGSPFLIVGSNVS